MASSKSTYWANALLNLVLAATAFSALSNTYIALYTVQPAAAGTGGTEATSGSYARKAVVCNTTNWPAASGGVISNGVAQSMVTATADWSGGSNQVAAALWDAVTAGNMLYVGALTQAKPVLNGDTATFAIGAIAITET